MIIPVIIKNKTYYFVRFNKKLIVQCFNTKKEATIHLRKLNFTKMLARAKE